MSICMSVCRDVCMSVCLLYVCMSKKIIYLYFFTYLVFNYFIMPFFSIPTTTARLYVNKTFLNNNDNHNNDIIYYFFSAREKKLLGKKNSGRDHSFFYLKICLTLKCQISLMIQAFTHAILERSLANFCCYFKEKTLENKKSGKNCSNFTNLL